MGARLGQRKQVGKGHATGLADMSELDLLDRPALEHDRNMSYEIERRPGDQPFAADDQLAWQLFASAPAVHFAAAGERPVLRTLSAVVLDGRLCFHGGDHGE